MTDGELVRQTLAGTTSAYGALARRWSARILAVCHARAGRTVAEDLAQESLLRGLRALPTLTDPEKFGPWLIGIAVRTCLDWLKSAKRSEVSLNALGAEGDSALAGMRLAAMDDTASDRQDRTERLLGEVEQLPLIYREAIMLYYYKQGTYQELADLLGVSAATINARLTKARAMLRERMLAERE
jgi:RNA polymerase sigma-70 factor (ECF subfamily)